jgi:3-deoxy-D-manno-octulosonate 8-phosphate phosphatase (KDO 8-P phosphatase)
MINISDIDVFIFDFDGVLTNNLVYLDQNGKESVSCNRGDGVAFDALRKIKKLSYIVSTEINPVVKERAKKLRISALHGVNNKVEALNMLANKYQFDLSKVMYVGNDINDYYAMLACGFSACPSDSHKEIKSIADIILKTRGGDGVVRELLEDALDLNLIKILYEDKSKSV